MHTVGDRCQYWVCTSWRSLVDSRDAACAVTDDARPPIRTFRRRGRMTDAKRAALDDLGPRYVIDHGAALDPVALFGRVAPLVVEIGFGDGEATVAHATTHPEHDVIAAEVHRPGIATLLQRCHEEAITNVRMWDGDVLDLLAALPAASVAEIHVFFPDPWPKVRHYPRRIVRADIVARWAELLVPGGIVHLATDWPHYATQMRAVLSENPSFASIVDDRADRPTTKYERLGLAACRTITDLRATRT
jgi:tRNA (guanine-N7-)-methyltransferase